MALTATFRKEVQQNLAISVHIIHVLGKKEFIV